MAKKLARFDNSKHPRGSKGRFVETPDPPGLAKARVYGTDNSSRKASRKRLSKSQEAKLDEIILARASKRDSLKASSGSQLSKARVYGSDTEARKLMLSRMNQAQKLRLLAAFDIADKQLVEAVAKAKASTDPTKRSRLSPEEKAAKEAEKKAKTEAKEAEKQRKAEEKAQKDAEAKALREKLDGKVRDAVKKSLDGTAYKKAELLDTINRYSIDAETGKPKLPKAPTERPEIARSRLDITEKGIEIWKAQPELGKHTGGFKTKVNKDFSYTAEVDGKEIVLNTNKTSFIFEGEVVQGIPSIHNRLRDFSDEQLVNKLAEAVQHVENHVERSIKAPAFEWSPKYHGDIPKEYVAANGKVGEYGGAEIHHIDQWAKKSFNSINSKLLYNETLKRFEDGEITIEEAKTQMKALLRPADSVKSGYEIDVAGVGERKLVILPAGAHNFTNPTIYDALHPEGIHPDTGKAEKFGIPKTGDGGREWFNGWNERFWAEFYRREAYIMRQEVNRRMTKGGLSKETVKTHWDSAIEGQKRELAWQKNQRKNINNIKKTILVDFLGERKFWTGKYK